METYKFDSLTKNDEDCNNTLDTVTKSHFSLILEFVDNGYCGNSLQIIISLVNPKLAFIKKTYS